MTNRSRLSKNQNNNKTRDTVRLMPLIQTRSVSMSQSRRSVNVVDELEEEHLERGIHSRAATTNFLEIRITSWNRSTKGSLDLKLKRIPEEL